MNLLKAEHINTGYGKRQVLFDISFQMNKGEILLLIGSNGSGKSTLLKTIYGLLQPWDRDGRIWFNGEDITAFKPSQLIRKGIVYIPQQNELFEDLTVKENLELSAIQTIRKGQLNDKMDEVLEQIPTLKNLLKRECNRLSGGERKLLSLLMALMNQPKLILFDEPLAGMSPANTKRIIAHIGSMKNAGIALIVIEHKIKNIFELADNVIGLKLGKLFKKNINTFELTNEVML